MSPVRILGYALLATAALLALAGLCVIVVGAWGVAVVVGLR